MEVQVERAAESLNHDDGTAVATFDVGVARPIAQHANNAPDEHTGDRPAKIVVRRQPVPQPVRHTQDPMPNRDVRKHPIDQVRGALCHPAPPAAWAERTLHEKGTSRSNPQSPQMKARDAARQPAALDEIAERLLDKAGQALAVAQPGGVGSERFEVITDDAVQDGVTVRPVLIDRRR
jgi:hypothetical protein